MNRWLQIITNQWRAKLASLLLAVLIWFLLRHEMLA